MTDDAPAGAEDATDGGEGSDGEFVFGGAEAVDAESTPTTGVVGPSPALDPADVVRIQLDAIVAGDVDATAARAAGDVPGSVRTLFDFATPSFRDAHGDLDGFAATFLGPIYDRLVGATDVERGPGERDGDRYAQAVLARHPDGDRTYEFVLAKRAGGKYDGCWLTEAVDLTYDGESPSFRRTPTVTFGDRSVTCEVGDQLRAVLLSAEGYSPHNDVTQVANCGGNGLCGTCAVSCDGEVDEMDEREQRRLSLPPHDAESGLRLSCQTHVEGDVVVEKHGGYWGQHVEDVAGRDDGDATDAADAASAAVDAEGAPMDGGPDDASPVDPASVVAVTDAEYAGEYEYAADGAAGAASGGGR
ncbi:2Fe-2S iron-sulfur cluster-binding protein [Halorubellus sp. PRR65]|uniref:2Fe-2S iron-sulfur cluster-binding protein n=1 Tax=Halorubellus sp. PRR65 TaxID=3098148 RepID=UPI002B261AE1|nr:2Fe-2S iron-sulfur cluster-binding protein [Halorubellus sp. PRR65]